MAPHQLHLHQRVNCPASVQQDTPAAPHLCAVPLYIQLYALMARWHWLIHQLVDQQAIAQAGISVSTPSAVLLPLP